MENVFKAIGVLLLGWLLYCVFQIVAAVLEWVWSMKWWLLLLGSVVIGLWLSRQKELQVLRERELEQKRVADAETARKQAEEWQRQENERQRQAEERRRQEEQRIAILMEMPTATGSFLIGYRITRTLRMVRVDGCNTHRRADVNLREEAQNAGANGIINMRVSPYLGGYFSAQGDAVQLERV